jgi:hypothetical protein
MSKQTAVEWLFNQIKNDIIGIEYDYADELKEAKVMEKEQIKDAHHNGFTEGTCFGAAYMYRYTTSEEYYNETYGGENEQD